MGDDAGGDLDIAVEPGLDQHPEGQLGHGDALLGGVHLVEVAWLALAWDPVHPVEIVGVLGGQGAPEVDAGEVEALDLDVVVGLDGRPAARGAWPPGTRPGGGGWWR